MSANTRNRSKTRLALAATSLLLACGHAQAQCPTAGWATELTAAGLSDPRAAVMFDDGSGLTLYVADTGRVVKRTANGWTQVGEGFRPNTNSGNGLATISSLAVLNNQLYAAGTFRRVSATSGGTITIASNIVRWNPTSGVWEGFGPGTTTGTAPTRGIAGAVTMGSTVTQPRVDSMWVLDEDGPGAAAEPALYVAGVFLTAGASSVRGVARWNGTAWSAMSTGHSDIAYRLSDWDHDNDPATPRRLIIGGRFATIGAGTTGTAKIAMWDPGISNWAGIGGGLPGINGFVDALTTFDPDGAGPLPERIAAGCSSFASFATLTVFDGGVWSDFLPTIGATGNRFMMALGTLRNGGGDALFAFVNDSDGAPTNNNRYAARWTQAGGWAFADGNFQGNICLQTNGSLAWVKDLRALDVDGAGPQGEQLVAMGSFRRAGTRSATGIAALDATTQTWSPLASGEGSGGFVSTLVNFDEDGAGPTAPSVIALATSSLGESLGSTLARWTGSSWVGYGGCAVVSPSDTLAAASDNGVPRLFLGGFGGSTGVAALKALRNGQWENVIGPNGETSFLVGDVAGLDPDGSGPSEPILHVSVYATDGNGVESVQVLRYDGTSWTTLPGAFTNTNAGGPAGVLVNLTPVDDGAGARLIASGAFTSVGSTPANHIARFDGAAWTAMGTGLPSQVNRCRPAAATLGGSRKIYIGGTYGANPGEAGVLRFDDPSWTLMPGAGTGTFADWAAISEFNDGTGNALWAVGPATIIDGVPLTSPRIAKFNGSAWSSVPGTGLSSVGSGVTILPVVQGSSATLWISGVSQVSPVSANIARYSVNTCRADFNCSGVRDVADIFSFLSAWFAGEPRADFDTSGVRDVADIFAFLSAWFAGC